MWRNVWMMTAGGAAAIAVAAGAQPPAKADKGPDAKVMQVQVILDHLGFSPGVVDGKAGQSLRLAIKGFQKANGLTPSGKMDADTAKALQHYGATPPVASVKLTAADFAGPFVGPIPHGEDKQAKLPSLGYQNVLEMLSERYHTTPGTLIALNSPETKLSPGVTIRAPNVATSERDYPAGLKDTWKQTLAGLNVSSDQPRADHITVDKSDKALSVYDANGKLMAQFPVTTGSTHDPLPIGHWKIDAIDYNPKFHYNPKLFWDAKSTDKKATLQPGPNGPVGVVWMDLTKPHYGIHGTPEPKNIGRTQSHGCVRLTNWDAARLSLMVKVGTPVIFQP
ncbi:MAG TPA: L,D-transpeptidase family protein [Sphingomonas sp.]|nr:L,D-transpeptidase family protein [Sphingomonas sp.]